METDPQALGCPGENGACPITKWVAHRDMGHPNQTTRSSVIESKASLCCAIDELVDNNYFPGMNVFLQRTTCSGSYNMATSLFLQSVYVGSIVDLSRGEAVPSAVPVEKGELHLLIQLHVVCLVTTFKISCHFVSTNFRLISQLSNAHLLFNMKTNTTNARPHTELWVT